MTAAYRRIMPRRSTSQRIAPALPPTTPYEDAVLGILAETLGRDVEVDDALLTLTDLGQVPGVVARIRRTTGVDVPVADYVEARTVAGLAAVVSARSRTARAAARPPELRARPAEPDTILSFDQYRLWMENQLLPGPIYNVHGRRRITGPLDTAAIQRSIRSIMTRHESLRTRFTAETGEPRQIVDPPDPTWRIRFEDVRDRAEPDVAARIVLDEELTTPFDLTTGPLLRCVLIQLDDDVHALGVTMHHIVSDAWSIGLFIRELTALYEADGDTARAGLAPLPVQYRDYAAWQRDWLTGDVLESQLSHWRTHLEQAPRALALPTVQRRTGDMRAEAGQVTEMLSTEETAALHGLCREQGVTSFMVLFTVFTTVLARWSGQHDIVVGVPVAGRTTSVSDRLIGFFVNLLPLRADLSGSPTFADQLERVRRVALDAYAHAEAPMDELVRDLDIVRDPRRTPLFEVVLNVVGNPEAEQVPTLRIEPIDTPSLFSRFDLNLTAQEAGGALRFALDFPADRCDEATGLALLGQMRSLLRAAVADTSVQLVDIAAEPAAEPGPNEPDPAPAPALALDRHATDGNRVAVVDARGRWTYRWAATAARRIASELSTHPGSALTRRVGVVRRPTASFLVTLAAVASTGAEVQVIETDDPALTRPLGLTHVLDPCPQGVPAAGTVDLSAAVADDGTSEPGGAASPAAGRDWATGRFGLGPADRFVILSHRPGHLMSALCTGFDAGATIVVPDRPFGTDAAGLADWLREQEATVVYVDPPVLRALAATGRRLPDLRCVLVENDGSLLPHDVETLRGMAEDCRCVGLYRVATDGRPSAWFDVPHDMHVATAPLRVPIGTPAAPVTLRHPSGRSTAVGEPGEIWIGPEPTGDLARRRPDGTLEFAGRVGTQPGIDPAEIVSFLRDAPGVQDALVIETTAGSPPDLIAYAAGGTSRPDVIALHNHLRTRLPEHLVPRRIVVLDSLPRTPWGDYDLRALPRPEGDDDGPSHAAPRTEMERQLVAIIEELLSLTNVGVHDSFFELGGFSMLATRLVARVRDAFGVEVTVRDVFESPSVDELAPRIVRAQGELAGTEVFEALLAEIEEAAGNA